MTIVESFLHGKPVIGSNIGGIPELLNHKTGFIFEPANELSLINVIKLSENKKAPRRGIEPRSLA